MKTPREFDYDLWSEEGRYMVRVKQTGEVCEVDLDIMRVLRAEEKRLRRSMQRETFISDERNGGILSLDHIDWESSEPAWLTDKANLEDSVLTEAAEEEFVKMLTPSQREVYLWCIRSGIRPSEYAKSKGVSAASVTQHLNAIRRKAKKYFLSGT